MRTTAHALTRSIGAQRGKGDAWECDEPFWESPCESRHRRTVMQASHPPKSSSANCPNSIQVRYHPTKNSKTDPTTYQKLASKEAIVNIKKCETYRTDRGQAPVRAIRLPLSQNGIRGQGPGPGHFSRTLWHLCLRVYHIGDIVYHIVTSPRHARNAYKHVRRIPASIANAPQKAGHPAGRSKATDDGTAKGWPPWEK